MLSANSAAVIVSELNVLIGFVNFDQAIAMVCAKYNASRYDVLSIASKNKALRDDATKALLSDLELDNAERAILAYLRNRYDAAMSVARMCRADLESAIAQMSADLPDDFTIDATTYNVVERQVKRGNADGVNVTESRGRATAGEHTIGRGSGNGNHRYTVGTHGTARPVGIGGWECSWSFAKNDEGRYTMHVWGTAPFGTAIDVTYAHVEADQAASGAAALVYRALVNDGWDTASIYIKYMDAGESDIRHYRVHKLNVPRDFYRLADVVMPVE